MRILFCNYEYPPLGGGGGVINALLAEELATRHAVTVLTSQGRGLPRERVENGVRVLRVPVLFRRRAAAASFVSMLTYLPMGWITGQQLLAREHFDLVNSHFVLPTGPVGDALARSAHIPHVISVHGGDLYDPSKKLSPHRHYLLRLWIRQILNRADAVIGQSRNTLANLARFYLPDLHARQIPLGIRRPPAITGVRSAYGFRPDDILFVTVGRLVVRKAVDQLIRMLARLSDPRAHLLIIGTGPEEPALRSLAKASNSADHIHFLGGVEETEKFGILSMSDLFVSTSQHEGFGLVFVEAMACGLPVVCYDHGGQTDFLEDGTTGHLVPLNDLSAFTDCCQALAGSVKRRRAMSLTNQRRSESLFIEHCAAQYERVFESAIITGHKTGPTRIGSLPDTK